MKIRLKCISAYKPGEQVIEVEDWEVMKYINTGDYIIIEDNIGKITSIKEKKNGGYL